MRNICLFSDDFRKFPIGEFPYDPDHSAAGEYHYVTPKGVCGEWKDQVCNYRYNGHRHRNVIILPARISCLERWKNTMWNTFFNTTLFHIVLSVFFRNNP